MPIGVSYDPVAAYAQAGFTAGMEDRRRHDVAAAQRWRQLNQQAAIAGAQMSTGLAQQMNALRARQDEQQTARDYAEQQQRGFGRAHQLDQDRVVREQAELVAAQQSAMQQAAPPTPRYPQHVSRQLQKIQREIDTINRSTILRPDEKRQMREQKEAEKQTYLDAPQEPSPIERAKRDQMEISPTGHAFAVDAKGNIKITDLMRGRDQQRTQIDAAKLYDEAREVLMAQSSDPSHMPSQDQILAYMNQKRAAIEAFESGPQPEGEYLGQRVGKMIDGSGRTFDQYSEGQFLERPKEPTDLTFPEGSPMKRGEPIPEWLDPTVAGMSPDDAAAVRQQRMAFEAENAPFSDELTEEQRRLGEDHLRSLRQAIDAPPEPSGGASAADANALDAARGAVEDVGRSLASAAGPGIGASVAQEVAGGASAVAQDDAERGTSSARAQAQAERADIADRAVIHSQINAQGLMVPPESSPGEVQRVWTDKMAQHVQESEGPLPIHKWREMHPDVGDRTIRVTELRQEDRKRLERMRDQARQTGNKVKLEEARKALRELTAENFKKEWEVEYERYRNTYDEMKRLRASGENPALAMVPESSRDGLREQIARANELMKSGGQSSAKEAIKIMEQLKKKYPFIF